MNRRNASCLKSLVLVAALGATAGPAVAAKNDVLVVPAVARMVGLAFDVQALRDVVLITYRGNAASKTPLLHVWNPTSGAWKQLSAEEYAFGQFMSTKPGTFYIVGTDSNLPSSVEKGAELAQKVIRINTLNVAETANTFNETMKFSEREWQALSDRHGLQTRDMNFEKRKWGRYGPPGSHGKNPRVAPAPATSTVAALAKEEATPSTVQTPDAAKSVEEPAAEPVAEPAAEPVATPDTSAAPIPDTSASQSLDPEDLPEAKPLKTVIRDESAVPAAAPVNPEDK